MKAFRVPATEGERAAEVTKFGIVGFRNFGLDIVAFNALLFTISNGRPMVAKSVPALLSASCSCFTNRHWTWRHRSRTGVLRELSLFLATLWRFWSLRRWVFLSPSAPLGASAVPVSG